MTTSILNNTTEEVMLTQTESYIYPSYDEFYEYNYSYYDYDIPTPDPDLQHAKKLWIHVAPILIFLGTVGNFFSIILLLRKGLRKYTTTIYLVCLNCADLCVLYTTLLRYWLLALVDADIREASVTSCRFHVFLTYLFTHFEAWVLVCIGTERLAAVFAPQISKRWFTRRFAIGQLLLVLIFSVLINSHFFWSFDVIVQDVTPIACRPVAHMAYFIKEVWHWIDFALASLVPFLLMSGFNTAISAKVLYHNHMLEGSVNTHRMKLTSMTVILFMSALVFCVTTMPISIFLVRQSHWFSDPEEIRTKGVLIWTCLSLLYYSNFAFNFVLYSVCSVRFRQQITAMFRCGVRIEVTDHEPINEPNPRPCTLNVTRQTPIMSSTNSTLIGNSPTSPSTLTLNPCLLQVPASQPKTPSLKPQARDWPIPKSQLYVMDLDGITHIQTETAVSAHETSINTYYVIESGLYTAPQKILGTKTKVNTASKERTTSVADMSSAGNMTPVGNTTSVGNMSSAGNMTPVGNTTSVGNMSSAGNMTPVGNTTSVGNMSQVEKYEGEPILRAWAEQKDEMPAGPINGLTHCNLVTNNNPKEVSCDIKHCFKLKTTSNISEEQSTKEDEVFFNPNKPVLSHSSGHAPPWSSFLFNSPGGHVNFGSQGSQEIVQQPKMTLMSPGDEQREIDLTVSMDI